MDKSTMPLRSLAKAGRGYLNDDSHQRDIGYIELAEDEDDDIVLSHPHATLHKTLIPRKNRIRRGLRRVAMFAPVLTLTILGFMHFLEALVGRSRILFNVETCDQSRVDWTKLISYSDRDGPFDTRDITPIACHSHNDYQRAKPLSDALKVGCTSIEADVFLQEGELLVGHDASTLRRDANLQNLYIDRLLDHLNARNQPWQSTEGEIYGVFEVDPSKSLVLLIDFKQPSEATFDLLHQQLEKLRAKDYLSYWDGCQVVRRPITVVLSGAAPFMRIAETSDRRDVFYDAPLHALTADFNISNSYYASTNLRASVGQVWMGHLLPHQMEIIRRQIQSAHAAGLNVRYFGTPSWPISLRNHMWHVLMKEGADILNVNDLRAAASFWW